MDETSNWTHREIKDYGDSQYSYGYKSATICLETTITSLLRELAMWLSNNARTKNTVKSPKIFSSYNQKYQEALDHELELLKRR